MYSTIQPTSSFSEFDQYTNLLKDDQKEDLRKDFDELVAAIQYEESIKNGTLADPLWPHCTTYSVPLPTVSHPRRSIPFDVIPVDIETGEMIPDTPQSSPNTFLGEYYESINLDTPQSSPNTCQGQFYEPMIFDASQSNPNTCPGLMYEPIISDAPQSSVNTYQRLIYEQNIPYDCNFGGAQPCMYDTQIEPTPDFDLLSVLSPMEKPKPTPRKSHYTVMNGWLVEDETGKKRRPLLHEFLRQLLDNRNYSHIAEYVDKKQGTFKIRDRKLAAGLWHQVKGRNSSTEMTYDKLARAIRYYYSSGIIRPTPGRFTFRFGSPSGFGKTWLPA